MTRPALTIDEVRELPVLSVLLRGDTIVFAKYGTDLWYEPGLATPVSSAQLVLRAHAAGERLRLLWTPRPEPLVLSSSPTMAAALEQAFGEDPG
jgi:hypothetical protein